MVLPVGETCSRFYAYLLLTEAVQGEVAMLESKNKKVVRRLFDEFYGNVDAPAPNAENPASAPDKIRIADAAGILEELGLLPPAQPRET